MPAIAPSRIAPNGPELPAAGVTATRPAIAPEQAPSSEPLWPSARSVSIQNRTPAAVAVKVLMSARPAEPLASSAEPALKPNQPHHKRTVPLRVMVSECGDRKRVVWGKSVSVSVALGGRHNRTKKNTKIDSI